MGCVSIVNQGGVIHQPLAMVCPASVDLKPDVYHGRTQKCITHTYTHIDTISQIIFVGKKKIPSRNVIVRSCKTGCICWNKSC